MGVYARFLKKQPPFMIDNALTARNKGNSAHFHEDLPTNPTVNIMLKGKTKCCTLKSAIR